MADKHLLGVYARRVVLTLSLKANEVSRVKPYLTN